MDSSDGVIDGVIHSDVLCPSQSLHETHCQSDLQSVRQVNNYPNRAYMYRPISWRITYICVAARKISLIMIVAWISPVTARPNAGVYAIGFTYANHGIVYGGQPVPWRAGTPLADSHSQVHSPSQSWQCSLQRCQDCDGLCAREWGPGLLAVPMVAAERVMPNSGALKLTMVSLFVSASFVNQHLPGVAERGW